jgi:hypothetical protein
VKETSKDLYQYYKPVVEARESPRPSLIVAKLYRNHAESEEEGVPPPSIEGSDNSDTIFDHLTLGPT